MLESTVISFGCLLICCVPYYMNRLPKSHEPSTCVAIAGGIYQGGAEKFKKRAATGTGRSETYTGEFVLSA